MSIATEFSAQGWEYAVLVPADVRHSLSSTQVAAVGDVPLLRIPWAQLLQRARLADCVVLAVQGPLVARFTDELELLRAGTPEDHEPVVVTGWVGIIIEKLVAGYLDRAGSDVIAVNSADNLRDFIEAGQLLGIAPDNLVLSGLPLLPAWPAPLADGPVRTDQCELFCSPTSRRCPTPHGIAPTCTSGSPSMPGGIPTGRCS